MQCTQCHGRTGERHAPCLSLIHSCREHAVAACFVPLGSCLRVLSSGPSPPHLCPVCCHSAFWPLASCCTLFFLSQTLSLEIPRSLPPFSLSTPILSPALLVYLSCLQPISLKCPDGDFLTSLFLASRDLNHSVILHTELSKGLDAGGERIRERTVVVQV